MSIRQGEEYYWGEYIGEIYKPNYNVWRYISFEQFTRLLLDQELHFRKVSAFPDRYEGTIPKAIKSLREKETVIGEDGLEDAEDIYSALNQHARESSYANCWHLNNTPSEAMWRRYGDRTLALVAELEDFRPAFEQGDNDDEMLYARPIRYVNFFKEFHELTDDERTDIHGAAAEVFDEYIGVNYLKRESFSFEEEFRLLHPKYSHFSLEELEEKDYNLVLEHGGSEEKVLYYAEVAIDDEIVCIDFTETPERTDLGIGIDLECLLTEIQVSPSAEDWFIWTLKELIDETNGPLSSEIVEQPPSVSHNPTS